MGILGTLINCAQPLTHLMENPLALPQPGAHELRILSPTLLELTLVNTRSSENAPFTPWSFLDGAGHSATNLRDFQILCDGKPVPIKQLGSKRRVIYAPLGKRDLRIGNWLYIKLAQKIAENQTVEVKNQKLWPKENLFVARADPRRWSPAIHANQVGYLPAMPKKAMVGYYLGTLGEMNLETAATFKLIETGTGGAVYEGNLTRRPDAGWTFQCYQKVFEADFTPFKTPGEYQLQVPGLGVSFPFRIDEGVAATFARSYALGIYHQRCGTNNIMPFTRFTHDPCHAAAAFVPVPQAQFTNTWTILASKTEDTKDNPRHSALRMKSESTCLYPFVNKGRVDVSGGHHDAGDYSKYMLNSASFIHFLMLAADVLPGVAALDNLGLPESGDGKSDVLQEAKWEADYVAKMQDADGGFFFLVYPRDREYESDVTPDHGDPQVVWPKTTASTAAAVAALAQCASSSTFKKQFPDAAASYFEKARKGWAFLERAIARHGKDGAYQKITHYGNEFMHDDELAWAACEMFLATGDPKFQRQLLAWFDPASPENRRWGWWRVYESYGNAIRSYAFAVKTGRAKPTDLDFGFLAKCQNEIAAMGEDQYRRARDSAYGTSFPEETKRTRSAGWYFSEDAAFDLAIAMQLEYPALNDPRPKYLDALLNNLNYIGGCNPVNITYLTGLGWRRQHNIVDQYAQNDGRVMPPPGIPIGNVQAGFMWLDAYKTELGGLSAPSDGTQDAPYAFYDRWGDSFNVTTEPVILNQARGLAMSCYLMAQTSLKDQPWKSASARIEILPQKSEGKTITLILKSPEVDLSNARILWETTNQQPIITHDFRFIPTPQHIESEAVLTDGRYVFAITNFPAK
jgi:hypothetical protein